MPIKPARTNIDRDPFPQLPFEHELMTPPPVRHVVLFLAGVAAIYFMLGVLAARVLWCMP